MEGETENSDATKTVITCEPTVDINFASILYEHLKNAINTNHEVEIHAGEVTKIDTAILQLFFAFMLEAKTTGLVVNWVDVSETFRASADLLGMSAELDLPLVV